MRYIIQCHKCKAKQTYEAKTLGECMELAHADGWRPTGTLTQRMCRKCALMER
jgi:hypothetical protein